MNIEKVDKVLLSPFLTLIEQEFLKHFTQIYPDPKAILKNGEIDDYILNNVFNPFRHLISKEETLALLSHDKSNVQAYTKFVAIYILYTTNHISIPCLNTINDLIVILYNCLKNLVFIDEDFTKDDLDNINKNFKLTNDLMLQNIADKEEQMRVTLDVDDFESLINNIFISSLEDATFFYRICLNIAESNIFYGNFELDPNSKHYNLLKIFYPLQNKFERISREYASRLLEQDKFYCIMNNDLNGKLKDVDPTVNKPFTQELGYSIDDAKKVGFLYVDENDINFDDINTNKDLTWTKIIDKADIKNFIKTYMVDTNYLETFIMRVGKYEVKIPKDILNI